MDVSCNCRTKQRGAMPCCPDGASHLGRLCIAPRPSNLYDLRPASVLVATFVAAGFQSLVGSLTGRTFCCGTRWWLMKKPGVKVSRLIPIG